MNLYVICIKLVFCLPSLPPKHNNVYLFLLWYMPSYTMGTIHMFYVLNNVQGCDFVPLAYNIHINIIEFKYTLYLTSVFFTSSVT